MRPASWKRADIPSPGPALIVFAALLAATGLMRLIELIVSARRMRTRPEAVVAEPALFPAMAALHLSFISLPLVEVLWLDRPFQPVVAGAALAVLLLATLLRVWTLRTLGRAWNVRVVAPEASAVVTDGPYRYIRHPNYLVVILEIAALPMVHSAWISALLLSTLNAAVLHRRIRTEEQVLRALPGWREAMKDRARLIPGVF